MYGDLTTDELQAWLISQGIAVYIRQCLDWTAEDYSAAFEL